MRSSRVLRLGVGFKPRTPPPLSPPSLPAPPLLSIASQRPKGQNPENPGFSRPLGPLGLGQVGRAGSGLGQRRTALVTGARDPASAALLGCWKILG